MKIIITMFGMKIESIVIRYNYICSEQALNKFNLISLNIKGSRIDRICIL